VESIVPARRDSSQAPSRRGSIAEAHLKIPEMIMSGELFGDEPPVEEVETRIPSSRKNSSPNTGSEKPDAPYKAPSEGSSSNARAARIGKQYRHKVDCAISWF